MSTYPPPHSSLDPALVTTAFEIPGHRIVRNIGVVRGIVVRSRNVFATIGASLQTLAGGDITLFTELCEKTRQDSCAMMTLHAAQLGANAVIAFRYDANELMSGVTEVLAYGTAVVVEKI
ncbi:MAG: YbjQ family protein [Edaphobacter sp.]